MFVINKMQQNRNLSYSEIKERVDYYINYLIKNNDIRNDINNLRNERYDRLSELKNSGLDINIELQRDFYGDDDADNDIEGGLDTYGFVFCNNNVYLDIEDRDFWEWVDENENFADCIFVWPQDLTNDDKKTIYKYVHKYQNNLKTNGSFDLVNNIHERFVYKQISHLLKYSRDLNFLDEFMKNCKNFQHKIDLNWQKMKRRIDKGRIYGQFAIKEMMNATPKKYANPKDVIEMIGRYTKHNMEGGEKHHKIKSKTYQKHKHTHKSKSHKVSKNRSNKRHHSRCNCY